MNKKVDCLRKTMSWIQPTLKFRCVTHGLWLQAVFVLIQRQQQDTHERKESIWLETVAQSVRESLDEQAVPEVPGEDDEEIPS